MKSLKMMNSVLLLNYVSMEKILRAQGITSVHCIQARRDFSHCVQSGKLSQTERLVLLLLLWFRAAKSKVEWWIIYQKSIRILLKIGPFFKWFGRACLLVWVSISPWCLLPFSLSLNLANLHHSAPPGLNGPETDHQTKPTIQNSIFNKGSVTILQSFIIKQAAEIPNSK